MAIPDLEGLSTTCNVAVTNCGFVAKKIELKAIDESVKTIRLEIKEKEKEIESLREKRKKSGGDCEACLEKKTRRNRFLAKRSSFSKF